MKLLVLAQTPPPLHGQSVMVQALVSGLPQLGIDLHHVNLRLSQNTADIGRWRMGKIFETFAYAVRTVRVRFKHHFDTLYYVPAPPAKRGALYRDWVLLLCCRPFFRRVVFHWHAVGLGEWLQHEATWLERIISHALLGRADLAIVLSPALQADAAVLGPRRVAIVPNGIGVPARPEVPRSPPPFRVMFLSLCSEEKGLFAAASAVLEANRMRRSSDGRPAFVLTAAGPFDRRETADRFHQLCGEHPNVIRHVGTVEGQQKSALFAESHALLLPSRYPAEGMPLVALEALAHDRPIVATSWRAMVDIVSPDVGILVPPANAAALATALLKLREQLPPPEVCRSRFLNHFTLEHHLTTLAAALRSLE